MFLKLFSFLTARMFKFLKKLFFEQDGEKAEKEAIKLGELEEWFKAKSDRILSELDAKVHEIKGRIKEEISNTKDNLSVLSGAGLHNTKISVRETQFMEGNRESYILAVNNLLRGIEIDNNDYSDLLQFCDEFNIRLEKFGKSTFRPYHILQEFFAHESRDIAINIKEIDSLVREIKSSIEKSNLGKINLAREEIGELKKKIKKKQETEKLLEERKNCRDKLLGEKGEAEKRIEILVKSREYKQLNELKAGKEAVLAGIRENNAKIVHAFSVMERPLRKLQRILAEDIELLDNYIENPVLALVEDRKMRILGILRKLEENLNNYTLDLKDKKREKVLETVKETTEEFLREFVKRHNELNEKLENLEKEIGDNECRKNEDKLKYELSQTTDDLEKANTEILGSEQELSKIDIKEIKNNLEKEINELLKVDVVISS